MVEGLREVSQSLAENCFISEETQPKCVIQKQFRENNDMAEAWSCQGFGAARAFVTLIHKEWMKMKTQTNI